jgi:hypothetical protein
MKRSVRFRTPLRPPSFGLCIPVFPGLKIEIRGLGEPNSSPAEKEDSRREGPADRSSFAGYLAMDAGLGRTPATRECRRGVFWEASDAVSETPEADTAAVSGGADAGVVP